MHIKTVVYIDLTSVHMASTKSCLSHTTVTWMCFLAPVTERNKKPLSMLAPSVPNKLTTQVVVRWWDTQSEGTEHSLLFHIPEGIYFFGGGNMEPKTKPTEIRCCYIGMVQPPTQIHSLAVAQGLIPKFTAMPNDRSGHRLPDSKVHSRALR